MKPPLLFLDIDGVLNSRKYFERSPAPPPGAVADEMFRAMLDPEAVAHLRWLLDRSRADVVLSSSWRHVLEPEAVAVMLRERGLGADWLGFVGETPRDVRGRGREIHAWLVANKAIARRFAVLDDDSDMSPVKRRSVQTTNERGLRREHAERVLKMLRASL